MNGAISESVRNAVWMHNAPRGYDRGPSSIEQDMRWMVFFNCYCTSTLPNAIRQRTVTTGAPGRMGSFLFISIPPKIGTPLETT